MSWRILTCTSRALFNKLNAAEPTALYGCQRVLSSNFLLESKQFMFGEDRKLYSTFLTQISGERLRDGLYGVSNAGKKKGRARRSGRRIGDLNKGQTLGSGRANMLWPGLNTVAVSKGFKMMPEQLPKDPQKDEELLKLRDRVGSRFIKLTPLERGYSGSRLPGRSIGPPDPVGGYTFDGFDTIVLELKTVTTMTGTLGRKMRFSAFVVTGNKNGIAGYGLGKSMNPKTALKVAKNRASQRLLYVPIFEDHTVYHNMYSQFYRSRIFIHKKEEGYGLRCHRVIKSICQMMGIKNLHCKVEASTRNVQNVTKAFFNAVINQETHSDLAERIGYHVVEFKKEEDYKPRVVASPNDPNNVKKEILVDEEEDLEVNFERLYYGGKCELPRRPKQWDYYSHPSYIQGRKKVHARRNQYQAAIMRAAGLS